MPRRKKEPEATDEDAKLAYVKSFQGTYREGIDPTWEMLSEETRDRWRGRVGAPLKVEAEPEPDDNGDGDDGDKEE